MLINYLELFEVVEAERGRWVKQREFGSQGHEFSGTMFKFDQKLLYRSRAGRHFYGTENVFWAGFGSFGNTEKKLGQL